MTRGMFATALGRMTNADVSDYRQSNFTDVKSDAYYMGYIEWASKNSIVKGTSNEKFAPDQSITREQMAGILGGKNGNTRRGFGSAETLRGTGEFRRYNVGPDDE